MYFKEHKISVPEVSRDLGRRCVEPTQMFSVPEVTPRTSAAKLEPDPASPSLWGVTPEGRPPAPRAPTKHGSGPAGVPPSLTWLERARGGPLPWRSRRPDPCPHLPSGTLARRIASGKHDHSGAALHGSPRRASHPQRSPPPSPPWPDPWPRPWPRLRPHQSTEPPRPLAPPEARGGV